MKAFAAHLPTIEKNWNKDAPLTVMDNDSSRREIDRKSIKNIQLLCCMFGFIMGVVTQIPSVCARIVVAADEETPKDDIIVLLRFVYSTCWTLATFVSVFVVRYLYQRAVEMKVQFSSSSSDASCLKEEMTNTFDSYFSLGFLISVSLVWLTVSFLFPTRTDFPWMDNMVHIAFPIVWLGVLLQPEKVAVSPISSDNSELMTRLV